jgi:hypothetical protein
MDPCVFFAGMGSASAAVVRTTKVPAHRVRREERPRSREKMRNSGWTLYSRGSGTRLLIGGSADQEQGMQRLNVGEYL